MNQSRLGSVGYAGSGILLFHGRVATGGVQSISIIFEVRVSLGYNVIQVDDVGFQ